MSEQTNYWGRDDDETLTYESADEAIEMILDEMHPEPFEKAGEITVYEFAPMIPDAPPAHWSPLTLLLERWEEDHGNPDGDGPKVTEAMLAAERTFIAAVAAEYRSWACHQTGNKVTVNALEWVREHRPDWLAERIEQPSR